jgi:hypothetical protein
MTDGRPEVRYAAALAAYTAIWLRDEEAHASKADVADGSLAEFP